MWYLFENKYKDFVISSDIFLSNNFNQNTTSMLQSKLDAYFDDDKEFMDKINQYTSEKPASKDIDVLAWWKVSILTENSLNAIYLHHV